MRGSDVIDRTYSDWLYPAGINRPAVDVLAVDISDAVKTFKVRGRIKEMPTGGILEVEDELMPIDTRSGVDVTVLERGYLESAPAAHLTGAQIRLNPEFSRVSVFNALKTVIGLLYPWNAYRRIVDASKVVTRTDVVPMPVGAKRVISVRPQRRSSSRWGHPFLEGRDYDSLKDVDGAPELQLYRGAAGEPLRIVYAAEYARPAAIADELNTLGIPESLQEGFPMAIAGQLLQGREIPRLNIEEVRRLLAMAGAQIPVGATFNVGQALLNGFRQLYVNAELDRLAELDPHTFEYVGA